jgi:glycosyltransferase involved in cell wall biosynthesis
MNAAASLHLALVTETFPPEVNGVAMTVGRMVDGLMRRGHRIDLVRPRQLPGEPPRDDHSMRELLVRGLALPRYPDLKFGLPSVGALLRRWRHTRPDLVVAVTEGPLGWSALRAARKLGIPTISEFHTNFHSYSAHYGMAWLERPVRGYLRKFHNQNLATLVPSEDIRSKLADQGFSKLEVVARGVDTELFSPAKRSQNLRGTWGAGDETQVVAYVGRMAAEKNLPLVVSAFKRMQSIRPDSKLLWVGDGPERAALQAAAGSDQIFAGMRRSEELAAHYASADVFLFPSTTETYGNVTMEAMASGLGVVVYDYAAARTHVRHQINGLKAEFNNEADLLQQACYAASHPEQVKALGIAARHTAEQHGWDSIVGRFEEVARAALARSGNAGASECN